jgi:hypothetical protein
MKEKDRKGSGVILDVDFVKELEQWDNSLKLTEAKQP